MKRSHFLWISAALLIVAGVVLLWPKYEELKRVETTKINLHELQIAVEIYKNDEPSGLRSYPQSIQQASDLGIMGSMPLNPYTGKPMASVPLGESATPGDFTYLAQNEQVGHGITFTDSYLLVGYSKKGLEPQLSSAAKLRFETEFKDSAKLDWEKVCIVLQADTDYRSDQINAKDEKRKALVEKYGGKYKTHKELGY